MHSLLCFSTASCPVVLMKTNFTLQCKLFHYCLHALDFETVEPINPLDGLLKKTKYGAEVVVGKSFPMSWLEAWQTWLVNSRIQPLTRRAHSARVPTNYER